MITFKMNKPPFKKAYFHLTQSRRISLPASLGWNWSYFYHINQYLEVSSWCKREIWLQPTLASQAYQARRSRMELHSLFSRKYCLLLCDIAFSDLPTSSKVCLPAFGFSRISICRKICSCVRSWISTGPISCTILSTSLCVDGAYVMWRRNIFT